MLISEDHEKTLLSAEDPKTVCTQSDLESIFRRSEDECSTYLWTLLLPATRSAVPDGSGTEASFHHFWDSNLRAFIGGIANQSKAIRDSNYNLNSETDLVRPDFGLLINGVCVFRGEERAVRFSGIHPRYELCSKLT